MPELGSSGSVRGAASNGRPYRESARSYCRWRARRCSVPRRPPPATATSTACDPWAVENRPGRSISLPRPRQRCAVWPRLANACEPGRPRSLLPPVAGGSGQPYRYWYRGPRQSGCHSTLRRLPRHRPSTGCVLWSAAGQDVCPCVSAHRAAHAPHRSAALRTSSRHFVSRSRCISVVAEPSIRRFTARSRTGRTSHHGWWRRHHSGRVVGPRRLTWSFSNNTAPVTGFGGPNNTILGGGAQITIIDPATIAAVETAGDATVTLAAAARWTAPRSLRAVLS